MSLENAAARISSEVGCDIAMAQRMAEQLEKVHEDLKPVVSAWSKGTHIGFEFKGITLDTIMEKEHCKYIQAVFSMNTLLDDPQFAEMYSEFQFDTDYLGG